MEAPEKIYLHPDEDGEVFGKPWSSIPFNKHNVEYTRTDAFIKKTVKYIANNMRCGGYAVQTRAKFIKDFKNYMKRE